jgi:integrase
VRNRLETLLDAAKARGLRSGDNPARWKGHLDHLLPRISKLRTVEHFAAIDYHAMSEFMAGLREQSGPAPAALDFTILTAARSGQVMGATWDEIDLDQKLWMIPAERTKARKEHRVPLSDVAMAVLADMAAIRMNEYVFPGQRGQLSHRMLQLALQRTGRAGITVHGFRSAFRDWSGNETHAPREVCEQALGHATGGAVELAYRRSDTFDKRRALMDA